MGDGLPLRGGSLRPLAQSRGGGGRDSAWGGRGNARRQAAYERGATRRGGAGARRWDDWGRGGGHASGGHSVRRAPEEDEAGILHPEVGDCSWGLCLLDWRGFNFLVFAFAGWRPPCPLSHLPKC
jgi:hypothetical protein